MTRRRRRAAPVRTTGEPPHCNGPDITSARVQRAGEPGNRAALIRQSAGRGPAAPAGSAPCGRRPAARPRTGIRRQEDPDPPVRFPPIAAERAQRGAGQRARTVPDCQQPAAAQRQTRDPRSGISSVSSTSSLGASLTPEAYAQVTGHCAPTAERGCSAPRATPGHHGWNTAGPRGSRNRLGAPERHPVPPMTGN